MRLSNQGLTPVQPGAEPVRPVIQSRPTGYIRLSNQALETTPSSKSEEHQVGGLNQRLLGEDDVTKGDEILFSRNGASRELLEYIGR
jgi:hypothetical protein